MGAESYASDARVNGKPGALLAVYQLNDANGIQIAKQCQEKLAYLKKTVFPEDLEYGIQYDTTKFPLEVELRMAKVVSPASGSKSQK